MRGAPVEPEARRALEQEPEPRVAHQPPDHQRAHDPGRGDDQRHHADIGDDAGLEQHHARRQHRQEERQVDDDGVLAAVAERFGERDVGEQRGDGDDCAQAPRKPSASETTGRPA